MQCPKCQHENPEGRKACGECGHALPEAAGISGDATESNPSFCALVLL